MICLDRLSSEEYLQQGKYIEEKNMKLWKYWKYIAMENVLEIYENLETLEIYCNDLVGPTVQWTLSAARKILTAMMTTIVIYNRKQETSSVRFYVCVSVCLYTRLSVMMLTMMLTNDNNGDL